MKNPYPREYIAPHRVSEEGWADAKKETPYTYPVCGEAGIKAESRREIAEWLEGDCPHDFVIKDMSPRHMCGICCHELYLYLKEGRMPE